MSPVPRSTGLDRRRFPIDPWSLRENRHNATDLGLTETLFCVGNGYLGLRDNPPEGRIAHQHGTFVNGSRIEECALEDGSVVKIGGTAFTYRSG